MYTLKELKKMAIVHNEFIGQTDPKWPDYMTYLIQEFGRKRTVTIICVYLMNVSWIKYRLIRPRIKRFLSKPLKDMPLYIFPSNKDKAIQNVHIWKVLLSRWRIAINK